MSRRSQAKRAARAKDRARQRARAQSRSQHDSPPGWFAHDDHPLGPDPLGEDPFDEDPFGAGAYDGSPFGAFGRSRPRCNTAADCLEAVRSGLPLTMLLPDALRIDEEGFCAEAEPVLVGWVRELYGAGWQPTELVRQVRMRAKTAEVELIRRVIAAERAARTDATASDPRWEQQWAAADVPGPVRAGWAVEWARAQPAGQEPPVQRLLSLAAVVGAMPRLEMLLPPPAGVRTFMPLSGRPAATADPVLEKVRALLAKAESTDHEPEALAFTAKAQELMTKHAIDLAMLESAQPSKDTPHIVRIPVDPPYADVKALLVQIVAEQTRCRTAYHANVAMSSVIGFRTDLEAVELLFTSLLVQAQRALAEASTNAPPGSRTRTQGFRAAFLNGFAQRIDARLTEVNRLAYADADAQTFLPVLRSRGEQVEEFVADRFSGLVSERVRGGYDPLGYARGEQAGDAAALTSGAVNMG